MPSAHCCARNGIDAVDIAPGKYFPRPAEATDAGIAAVKAAWRARGMEITGMQALLFGTTGLNVFGSEDARAAMLAHLAAVCRIGGGLGATRLVFGSPRNRDRGALDDEQAEAVAVPFFRALGDIAAQHGVIVCLEPNPPVYGANYMTDSTETAAVVRRVGHPSIRMQLDSGALAINGEDPARIVADCAGLVGHIHASEPGLLPLGDGDCDHGRMHAAIRGPLAGHVVCIEMVATVGEPHLESIARALRTAIRHYRPGGSAA
jgi:D-psicose/D-tagatose/L-ribulose 3-epimerase